MVTRMPDDNDDDMPRGMAFPIDPAALFEVITGHRKQHERAHMEADRRTMSVDNFMESLTPEQLLALRYVLNAGKPTKIMQFFDGQAYALLKWKHGVDPHTGDDPFTKLMEESGKSSPAPTQDTDKESDDHDGA